MWSNVGCIEDAQAALAREDFELVLLDVNMPGMNGMAGLLSLRNAAPATPVVIVSGREDRETVDQAMGCGAAGFIPKSLSRDGMRSALCAVLAGEISLPGEPAIDGVPDRHAAVATLSGQQRRVLEMISAGKANKIIAYELSISESTVKSPRHRDSAKTQSAEVAYRRRSTPRARREESGSFLKKRTKKLLRYLVHASRSAPI